MLVTRNVMEQRYEAVMAVLRDGEPVTEVAQRFGVSRQSVHAWIGRYENGGIAALADGSHRPAQCPHQMPAEVEAEVCELRTILFDYIEVFYNRSRHQVALDDRTPAETYAARRAA